MDELEVMRQQFLARLSAAPEVDVWGVVAFRGVGAGIARGDALWNLNFDLDVWRIGEAELNKQRLLVRWGGTEDDISKFRHLITPQRVVHIRVRVVYWEPTERYTAQLESFVGLDNSDAELNTYAHELAQPVILELPPLPTLTADGYGFSWSSQVLLQSWTDFHVSPELYGEEFRRPDSGGLFSLWIDRAEIKSIDDRKTPPSPEQAAAYQYLVEHEASIFNSTLKAIFNEYAELQASYGGDEEYMPDVEQPDDLRSLIRLEGVTITVEAIDGAAFVGFNFDCLWDPEHGFGVAMHKGRVLAVAESGCAKWAATGEIERRQKPSRACHALFAR